MNTKTAAIAFVVLLSLATVAHTVMADQDREHTDARGVITAVNVSQGWYGIVPDTDPSTRYSPEALAEEFRKDGLRVVFSGHVGRVDPNVRTWGIPLVLTKIRVE